MSLFLIIFKEGHFLIELIDCLLVLDLLFRIGLFFVLDFSVKLFKFELERLDFVMEVFNFILLESKLGQELFILFLEVSQKQFDFRVTFFAFPEFFLNEVVLFLKIFLLVLFLIDMLDMLFIVLNLLLHSRNPFLKFFLLMLCFLFQLSDVLFPLFQHGLELVLCGL
jgi:hypothetical protein